ncbi:MAG: hypothetical protein OQK81_01465 [Candidatus Bathyarchaeota archaeon]|jgi:hypothetical protein|nr:hypothetical protein [Candidatus Bathyarchaeota archaeon]
MASYSLLIGTNGAERTLIASGQPVEIRRQFKDVSADDGFELVEVVDKHQGRIRHRRFAKPIAKKAAKKASKKAKK